MTVPSPKSESSCDLGEGHWRESWEGLGAEAKSVDLIQ